MASQSFIRNISRRGVKPRIQFVHDGTNYEDYVIKISQVKRDANLTAGSATVTLNNGTGLFNFWKATDTALNEKAQIKIYIDGSPADTFTLFAGKVQTVEYTGSRVIVHIRDHVADALSKPYGSGRSPVVLWPLGMDPDEMVFRVLVGSAAVGISPITGVSNEDLNWTSFVNWRDNYIRTKSYSLCARFTSQSARWILLKIAQMTHSYIYVDTDGKFAFAPPLGTGETYDETNSKRSLRVSMDNMLTRMNVRYGYDVNIDSWDGNSGYQIMDDPYEAQYGRFSYEEESRVIWHRVQVSANTDRAQTMTDFKRPIRMFTITTGLAGMLEEIGNTITVNDTIKGITSASATVEEVVTDMESRTVTLKARWGW